VSASRQPTAPRLTNAAFVREHDAVRQRTLEITFLEPGAEAYAFTFG
jgi:predicted Zn-dependent peptidase